MGLAELPVEPPAPTPPPSNSENISNEELDESESAVLKTSVTGYTGGGTQLLEAGERQSNSRWAVGRFDLE